jgi:hypothetical protein
MRVVGKGLTGLYRVGVAEADEHERGGEHRPRHSRQRTVASSPGRSSTLFKPGRQVGSSLIPVMTSQTAFAG